MKTITCSTGVLSNWKRVRTDSHMAHIAKIMGDTLYIIAPIRGVHVL